jgi:hypothetical protein
LSWATIVTVTAAGWTLLLPWSYGRRIGLTVWRLGYSEHPLLCAVWAAGMAAAIAAVVLQRTVDPTRNAMFAAAGSAGFALVFTGWSWGSENPDLSAEAWAGPGPALAGITGLLWLLASLGQIVTSRRAEPPLFTDYALREATTRLRRTRNHRPAATPPIHRPPPAP